jgi:hypothetical protein
MIILASTGPVISVRRRSSAFGSGANLPFAFAYVPGFRQKIRHFAGIDARLASHAGLQQFLAAAVEGTVQLGDQGQRLRRENGFVTGLDRRVDLHSCG